jgi:hypothetical protein
MSHPKDNEIYPIGTKVLILRGFNKGKTAVITHHNFLKDGKTSLIIQEILQEGAGRLRFITEIWRLFPALNQLCGFHFFPDHFPDFGYQQAIARCGDVLGILDGDVPRLYLVEINSVTWFFLRAL